MAFNPFHTFRKYRTFWISGLILVAMLSFIVCSGVGSQEWLQALLMQWFGGQGQAVATINGRNVTYREIKELEVQRQYANDFMRAATEFTIFRLNQQIEQAQKKIQASKKKETVEQEQASIQQFTQWRRMFQERLRQPNYFGGGNKLDDTINFMLWRDQADRLGVVLTQEGVTDEINRLVMGDLTYYDRDVARAAEDRVRELHSNQRITVDQIAEALRQEFRVQIAKFALAQVRTDAILQDPGTDKGVSPMQAEIARIQLAIYPEHGRLPMSPHELWQSYKDHLTRYDIALLPINVNELAEKVSDPDETHEIQLQGLFDKYQKTKYNPASDIPGFVQPEKIKVQYVTASPHSEYYQKQARLATTLEATPPVWWDAGLPGFGTALRLAAGKPAWQASMQFNFDNDRKIAAQNDEKFFFGSVVLEDEVPAWWVDPMPRDMEYVDNVLPFSQRFLQPPLTDPNFHLDIYFRGWLPEPADVAGLVGSGSLPGLMSFGPANLQAAAVVKQKDTLKPVIDQEIDRRVPIGATLVLAGADSMPFQALGMWDLAYKKIDYLPFQVFDDQYRRQREEFLATDRVKDEMEKVRDRLTDPAARGFGPELQTRLENLKQQYPGLEIHETEEAFSEFTIGEAKELAPFERVFNNPRLLDMFNMIEGRQGTERILKPGEFKRLFFDQSEQQIGVAAVPDFVVQQWPPEAVTPHARPLFDDPEQLKAAGVTAAGGVKIDMWRLPHAEQFVLFWKSKTQRPEPPKTLDEVRDAVVHAWKVNKAREELLRASGKTEKIPRLEELGEKLLAEQRAGRDVLAQMQEQAKKLDTQLIMLDNVSEWVPIPRQFGIDYGKWQLPKDKLLYPRGDATEQILSLANLEKPLRTVDPTIADKEKKEPEDPRLDKINENLHKEFKKMVEDRLLGDDPRPVQILTNKARSAYYVATVVREYPPDLREFYDAYIAAMGMGQRGNLFVMTAQQQAVERHIEELTAQLRRAADVRIISTEGFE